MSRADSDAEAESRSEDGAANQEDSGERFDVGEEEERDDSSDDSQAHKNNKRKGKAPKSKKRGSSGPPTTSSNGLDGWSWYPSIEPIEHPFNPSDAVVVGPQVRRSLLSSMTPLMWFHKFFTPEMAALTVAQTNIKGRSKWPTTWRDLPHDA